MTVLAFCIVIIFYVSLLSDIIKLGDAVIVSFNITMPYLTSYFYSPPSVSLHVHRDTVTLSSSHFRYLYFEYNEIREVDPGTFDSMPSLQLLFLNANLLRSLPLGVFSGVNLARLNLRNNHLLQLPMVGVLEHLTGLVQVGANLFTE